VSDFSLNADTARKSLRRYRLTFRLPAEQLSLPLSSKRFLSVPIPD
jgi:hypothetical protein